jgi:hypothetical protein
MESNIELKHTELGKDYWSENAVYADFLSEKYDLLVPARGEADTMHGELIRCFSRLVYEHCNNGNCNANDGNMADDDCSNCYGDGKVRCDECYGDGYVECDECDGDDENCSECDGSGNKECEQCNGDGETECDECLGCGVIYDAYDDPEIDSYYENILHFLEMNLPNGYDLVEPIRQIILNFPSDFSDETMHEYSKLGDAVAHRVLTTENEKREINECE